MSWNSLTYVSRTHIFRNLLLCRCLTQVKAFTLPDTRIAVLWYCAPWFEQSLCFTVCLSRTCCLHFQIRFRSTSVPRRVTRVRYHWREVSMTGFFYDEFRIYWMARLLASNCHCIISAKYQSALYFNSSSLVWTVDDVVCWEETLHYFSLLTSTSRCKKDQSKCSLLLWFLK